MCTTPMCLAGGLARDPINKNIQNGDSKQIPIAAPRYTKDHAGSTRRSAAEKSRIAIHAMAR